MEEFFYQHSLFPFVDLVLVDKYQENLPLEIQSKAIPWNLNPKDVIQHLQTAEVVYIHPDGFDKWTDILFYLAQKMSFPTKLIVIAGSDYAVGDEHMEPFVAFFPKTKFWITNWCGSLPACTLLPLGIQTQALFPLPKSRSLGISFVMNYKGYRKREEFYAFLNTYPSMKEYCIPRVAYQEYCTALSECYFSTCPMGGGYDTFRFWECLMVGTIPIVKDHPFYDTLQEEYPTLPMIRIQSWDDLPILLKTLTKERWETMMLSADLTVCKTIYWLDLLKHILQGSDQN